MELWVVEYSAVQRCFHVDLLADALTKNRRALLNGEHPDFVPIGLFLDLDSAERFTDHWAEMYQNAQKITHKKENRPCFT